MRALKGVRMNGDPNECMVVGCNKKALYRNAMSNKTSGTQRGYCSDHREMAVGDHEGSWPAMEKYMLARYGPID